MTPQVMKATIAPVVDTGCGISLFATPGVHYKSTAQSVEREIDALVIRRDAAVAKGDTALVEYDRRHQRPGTPVAAVGREERRRWGRVGEAEWKLVVVKLLPRGRLVKLRLITHHNCYLYVGFT